MVSQQLQPDSIKANGTDHNYDSNRVRCGRAASLAGGPGAERSLLSLLRPAAPVRRHSSGYCPAPASGVPPVIAPPPTSGLGGGGFKYCPSDALPYCPPSRPLQIKQLPIPITTRTPPPPPPIPQRVPVVPKRTTPSPHIPPVVPPPPRRVSPQTRIPLPAPIPPPPPARNIPPQDKNSHLFTMYTNKQPVRPKENPQQKNEQTNNCNNSQFRSTHFDFGNNNLINNTTIPEQDHNQNVQKSNNCFGSKKNNGQKNSSGNQDHINSNKKVNNVPPPLPSVSNSNQNNGTKGNLRQDSSVSSDSFSQTSSPSYTSKTMEAPLLPHHHSSKSSRLSAKLGQPPPIPPPAEESGSGSPLTKSASTPASLQTIVRFQNGTSNMSLHHKIIRDLRRSSNTYVPQGRLKYRILQVLLNLLAIIAIAGGISAYFRAYPSVQVINKTVTSSTTTVAMVPTARNPAPGVCLPVIVNFCQYHRVPYNFTVFPNYIGNFGQRDAQQELEIYDAVVDVRCYELAALFLCSVFVPKCGPMGHMVGPCKSLCFETMRRCGFFLDVFGLSMPEYLQCKYFSESADTDVCLGHREVHEARVRAQKPVCPTGFQCDTKRCIPADWRCDGHVDCLDQSDELNCKSCGRGTIHCGERRCMAQSHVCDGKVDCPWGQDERNCLRLSESNGDVGRGQLQLFRPEHQKWQPACVTHWDLSSPGTVCAMLGYSNANFSTLTTSDGNELPISSRPRDPSLWRMSRGRDTNMLKEFRTCSPTSSNVNLVCTDYICGKTRQAYAKPSNRIIGGVESAPGDWPFLAAILGGPEEIFYCAGVLIADQWVLTASHCVGNHSDVTGWTIQLGITRRHAHSYYGQKMKVKRVLPHPLYNLGVAHDNDVALFQLASPVTFHEQLLPVCLPPPTRTLPEGTMCTVIGWGKREDKDMSEYEPAVNEVQVPVLNRELCNSWLEHRDLNVTEGMICAGYPEGGKDACQGDSGGPLLCRDPDDKQRWFVGGIVSWGIKCAHPRLPGVYAFVPRYVPWIRQQLELHSD